MKEAESKSSIALICLSAMNTSPSAARTHSALRATPTASRQLLTHRSTARLPQVGAPRMAVGFLWGRRGLRGYLSTGATQRC